MKSHYHTYLVVNSESAWPLEGWWATWYNDGVYSWPECEVVGRLGPEWVGTMNGNYVRKLTAKEVI